MTADSPTGKVLERGDTGDNMARKKTDTPKRNGRVLGAYLSDELYRALTEFVRSNRPAPYHAEVLRVALEDFLAARGFWPPKK